MNQSENMLNQCHFLRFSSKMHFSQDPDPSVIIYLTMNFLIFNTKFNLQNIKGFIIFSVSNPIIDYFLWASLGSTWYLWPQLVTLIMNFMFTLFV